METIHHLKHQTHRWWLNQPIWKICSSNWKSSPSRDENIKYLKPPPKQGGTALFSRRLTLRSWDPDQWLVAKNLLAQRLAVFSRNEIKKPGSTTSSSTSSKHQLRRGSFLETTFVPLGLLVPNNRLGVAALVLKRFPKSKWQMANILVKQSWNWWNTINGIFETFNHPNHWHNFSVENLMGLCNPNLVQLHGISCSKVQHGKAYLSTFCYQSTTTVLKMLNLPVFWHDET